MGFVARDDVGEVSFAATRHVRAHWPVEVPEGKALCLAIKLARSHNCQNVIFETDCVTFINRLSRSTILFSDLDVVLEDAIVLSKDFDMIRCVVTCATTWKCCCPYLA